MYQVNVTVRQCLKCYKFSHPETKCKAETGICVNCGKNHEGVCSSPVACANCVWGGGHSADYNECPDRLKEKDILGFKCKNLLTFSEAYRRISQKEKSEAYAKKIKTREPHAENLRKHIEIRTNSVVQILNRVITDEFEKIQKINGNLHETLEGLRRELAALTQLMGKCLSERSGEGPLLKRKSDGALNPLGVR